MELTTYGTFNTDKPVENGWVLIISTGLLMSYILLWFMVNLLLHFYTPIDPYYTIAIAASASVIMFAHVINMTALAMEITLRTKSIIHSIGLCIRVPCFVTTVVCAILGTPSQIGLNLYIGYIFICTIVLILDMLFVIGIWRMTIKIESVSS